MNNYRENLNKKIEETKKNFEKMFSCPVSYHEEWGWNGSEENGHFTIKLGNSNKIDTTPSEKWYISDTSEKKVYSNKEIEKYFENIGFFVSYHEEDIGGGKKKGVLTPIKKSVLGNGQPVNFQIENSERKLVEVSKEEFANWMGSEKNVKTPPKESLVYGAKGDIDGIEVYVERKGKDGVVKESYYEPRSEEEKKQIIERNRKRREQEKTQTENSPNYNKQQSENKETNQQNFSQKPDNKESAEKKDKLNTNQQISLKKNNNKTNNKNIYYGIGIISLVLLLMSMVIVSVKKKRLK